MQEQQKGLRLPRQDQGLILLWVAFQIARGHACCFLPFMRHTFGPRFFQPGAFIALVMLQPLAAASLPARLYLYVWLVALIGQRVWTCRVSWKIGRPLPSSFNGLPWWTVKLPFADSEEKAKQSEAFICLFVGLLVATITPPLGFFIMAGFVSMSFCRLLGWWFMQRERQAMMDAEYEMYVTADTFKR